MATTCNRCGEYIDQRGIDRCPACGNRIDPSEIEWAEPENVVPDGFFEKSEPGFFDEPSFGPGQMNGPMAGYEREGQQVGPSAAAPPSGGGAHGIERPYGPVRQPSDATGRSGAAADGDYQLVGQVFEIHRSSEPEPFNGYKWMTRLLEGLLLSPLIIMIFTFATVVCILPMFLRKNSGPAPINPFAWAFKIIGPFEVLVLRRGYRADALPVIRGLVRDEENQMHEFFLYGQLTRGNFHEGHRVGLRGQWGHNTLIVEDGYDFETRSNIETNYASFWKRSFFIMAGLFAVSFLIGLAMQIIQYGTLRY